MYKNKFFLNPFIFLLLLILPILVRSQITLKAYVSSNTVTTDQQFEYSVEVSGSSTNLPDIKLPAFKDFFVLSGPNQSTNISFVNGKSTASKTFSYFLQARAEGTFNLEKASVNVDGKTIESESIQITVKKAQTNAKPKPDNKSATNNVSNSDIFLKSVVSKHNAYIGEQIIVEYKLYFKNQVRTYEMEQDPSATGFWKEDFDLPPQPLISKEVINGLKYNVATLKKMAIFPTRVGKLELEPMVINLEVIVPNRRRSRQSIFDSFFEPSGRSIKQTVRSKATVLNINSLPEKNKPAEFAGAVGNFTFSVNVDKTSADVNEAVALKIRLQGTGNLKLAELPLVEIPTDIEQYEPKITSDITKKNNVIGGFKQAEYILIPRIPGEFKLKTINFSYFDPVRKRYITKTSGPITLTISGEASAMGTTPMTGYSRKEVTLLGRDIRFIKENTVFSKASERDYLSGFLISGFILGVALFAGFLIYDDQRIKLAGNVVLAKSRYASKLASKLLAEAKTNLKNNNSVAFYKSINTALSRFIQDKLNIELTDYNIEIAKTTLKKKNVPDNLINEYGELIQECEFKQFAAAQDTEAETESFMEKARKLITEMEKYI